MFRWLEKAGIRIRARTEARLRKLPPSPLRKSRKLEMSVWQRQPQGSQMLSMLCIVAVRGAFRFVSNVKTPSRCQACPDHGGSTATKRVQVLYQVSAPEAAATESI